MTPQLRVVVVGTVASNPYAGLAWLHLQIVLGLLRLGHDAYYFETTSSWPYDPARAAKVCDSDYAVPYLARVASAFGLDDRWAYRRSYGDGRWFGLPRRRAEELLARADLVLNVTGATLFRKEGLEVGRLVYWGNDPVFDEITYTQGVKKTRRIVREHDDFVTFGENIGSPECPVPPLPGLRATTRQPIVVELWRDGAPTRSAFTTIANWKQEGREVRFRGEDYAWSKDLEFQKFIDVPRRSGLEIELATNLAPRPRHGEGEPVRAFSVGERSSALLETGGWRIVDGPKLSTQPRPYRDYIGASRGEFTVARDLHVRLRSGWFSERSACYLAAGRPVVTQDTGFGTVLPTGEGLFAFTTAEEALGSLEAIEADYERHSRAASAIADEYFRAETVLAKVLSDLGC